MGKKTKEKLIEAFDTSKNKSVLDMCRIVGIVPSTFYFHFNKDAEFRRQIVEKQREYLAQKISEI